MLRLVLSLALALVATGCASTSVRTSEDATKAFSEGQGLVVVGLSKHKDFFGIGFIVDLSEVDLASGRPKGVRRDAAARVFFPETNGLLDGWDPTLDFVRVNHLPPGDYTLGGMTLTATTQYGIRPSQFYDRVERDRLPPYDPNDPKGTRPIFTVEAGKAVYIGHLMIDRRRIENQADDGDAAGLLATLNLFSGHGPRTEGIRSYRVLDKEAEARSAVAEMNIPASRWTKELIWLNVDERPGVASSGRSAERRPLGAPSAGRALPPTGSALHRLPDAELRRRFLAGEISMEEYNKARAGQ
jgi:hypothetical protein